MTASVDRLQFFLKTNPVLIQSSVHQKDSLENLLIASMPLYSRLSVLDRQGRETAKVSRFYTFLPGELTDQADNPAFQSAVVQHTYIGPVAFLGNTGLLSVTVAVPVSTPTENQKAVLIAEVNVTHLWQRVSRIRIGRTGYAYLVDTNGLFVAYQKPSEILNRYGENMMKMPPVADFTSGDRSLSGRVYEYRGLSGENVIGTCIPVRGTHWAVVTELPASEAYESIREMKVYLFGLMFLCVVASGGLGFLLARQLVNPIRTLTAAARQFESGDLETEFMDVARDDEVGILSHAFKRMQIELRRDIKKRKQSEAALRESEAKYRMLVDNASDAIFIAQDGFIKFSNRKTEELLGYSAKELCKKPFTAFIHPDDRATVAQRHARRLRGEQLTSTYSFKIITQSGLERIVQLNTVLIEWEGSRATLNFLRDVTELKQLEDRILHSQKMEAIGTLTGGIAHDFNNILGIIVGNAELAMEDVQEWNPARFNLKEIKIAGKRASGIVKQLLSFSRKTIQELKPIVLKEVLTDALKLLRPSLPSSIEIRKNLPESDDLILADPIQIHQVIMNLCINASHAMEQTGGILEIDLDHVKISQTLL